MQKTMLPKAAKYAKRNHLRQIWRKFVRVMACVVVFCTTYALILPAITMEKYKCGLGEHIHSESCYEKVVPETAAVLACTYESLGVHVHTPDCYSTENVQICGQADYLIHAHGAECMDENGAVVCRLPEISAHVHTQTCWKVADTAPAETEAPHFHGDTCYTQGDLLCQLTEQDGHSHETACYAAVLACGQEEGIQETAGETLSAAEPELICTEPAAQVHIHSESCFVDADAQAELLTCTQTGDHTHSTLCYGTWKLICTEETHSHVPACMSDPEADVETEADWKATVANAALTGAWNEDLLAVARTQLGYEESKKNYQVMEDGQTIKGYTRYGAWGGNPYGDWNAMFVSFCLNYAKISPEAIPYESDCSRWVEALRQPEYDLYRPATEYTPIPGDLIFFDWEEDGTVDHMGIVAELIPATEEAPEKVRTVEGDSGDCVAEREYNRNDSQIAGYARLPEKPPIYCCGLPKHQHDESCVDENGEHICGFEEHLHGPDCDTLTDAEWTQVQSVIALIDAMPSSGEIDTRLMEYEDAGDLTGQDAYFQEVWDQVCSVYSAYDALSERQKAAVTNADKLMELDYMWGEMAEASAYAIPDISGYNRSYGGIIPIDGYLGVEAGYNGQYNGQTKNIVGANGCNVIYIDLPADTNLAGYFHGQNELAANGSKQGKFNIDLYNDWAALDIETCDTYPFYYVERVYNKYSTKASIGNMMTQTSGGFILLVRRSFIAENNLNSGNDRPLWIPTGTASNYARAHLNQELLRFKKGWESFTADPGYLPSLPSEKITLGYVTLSPYDAEGDAGAMSDDKNVVDNIKFKLFDYSEFINKVDRTTVDSDVAGEIHSKYRALANYFYFRGGIEKHANRDYYLDIADRIPNVNTASQDGAGHSKYDQDGFTQYHARVEPNLWNGYPRLDFTVDAKGNAITPPSGWGAGEMQNPRSLRYLFDESYAYSQWGSGSRHQVATGAVTEYSPKNTILQFNQNNHTYWYNSAQNAVDYDKDAQLFRVRNYVERTSITADWMFGDSSKSADFLPFNYCNGIVNATYHPDVDEGTTNEKQYSNTDSSYRMNDVNYWFGMTMEFTFIQGKDGTVTYTDSKGVKHTDVMKFTFGGDDDVWVFIDGVRVLDLGGTHGSVTGSINFQTGAVTQALGGSWDGTNSGAGANSFPTTLKKCFQAAGKTPKGGWDNDGTGTPAQRFADYSIHTLKFFYLERGTAVANCRIEFNMPNFDNPLIVSKTLEAADEDADPEALEYLQENAEYAFRILETDQNGVVKKDENGDPVLFAKEGQEYSVVEYFQGYAAGARASTPPKKTVGANGIFTLKHGQQAVFEDILKMAGYADKYFVVQEILPGNQTGNYGTVQYKIDANGGFLVPDDAEDLSDLTGFKGFYSPAISAGAPQHVQMINVVDTETLSTLKVSKQVTEDSEFETDTFDIRVKMNGAYLPAGTKYKIDTTEYEMTEAGTVTLRAGQTAEILVRALAGTTYEVEEVTEDGWVVTYTGVTTDADGNETRTQTGSGTFPLDGNVEVTVTNSTYLYRVPITFSKLAMNSKSSNADFAFTIQRCTDTGEVIADTVEDGIGLPDNITINVDGQVQGEQITFVTFGSGVEDGIYYFKLTENDLSGWITDPGVYIIGVQIANGKAEIVSVNKDGDDYGADQVPAFVNYKKLTVTVDKTVIGNDSSDALTKEFTFTAQIILNGTQIAPDPGTGYTVAEDGTITFTLKHGESVKINGVPYSGTFIVTEAETPGFKAHYSIKDGGDHFSNTVTVKKMYYTTNAIHFVNSGGYMLPETGGAGTLLYTIGGLLLSAVAILLYIYNTKHRKEALPSF